MAQITYLKGDATVPLLKPDEISVIAHCNNSKGAWGAGFVVPLGKKYPLAKKVYLDFIKETPIMERLGKVSYTDCTPNISIANIVGQFDYRPAYKGQRLVDYDAIRKGFQDMMKRFSEIGKPYTVHMPRIGCGLANGKWDEIEKVINETFIENGIDVYVYDLV